ncbi:hypothetical protein F5Y18DRAFT_369457 [Xylariaceae sp. FL1019]|nr:hypothetical protein F5Y18DRAFT_369457 [Xylariaceae sp. FL1019]
MAMSLTHPATVHPLVMSRPQVGIERLPTRRMSNEPRESMNCKSCRKRKIKCNRLRPSCEACQVFQCPCVYDAVPKKRGPKTDVLEALLKRVDGLEAQLKEKKTSDSSPPGEQPSPSAVIEDTDDITEGSSPDKTAQTSTVESEPKPKRIALEIPKGNDTSNVIFSPVGTSEMSPEIQMEALLDTYFNRFHAKPYHILDESLVRQRLQLNQLPMSLLHAIYAVAARYTSHPTGYQSAVILSEEFASRSRKDIDTDEPSFDTLQTLLLLVIAYTAAGKGKKAYMLLTNAIGMATALELHREVDSHAPIAAVEREMRRRLFWSCYLLDRFMACGSKRPCLAADKTIFLKLPCWSPTPGSQAIEGEFFQSGINIHSLQGSVKKFQGGSGMLIDITRILGVTNRYLAAGGVKGDSHFPWHTLSSLSKIRQDLDIWASGTDDVFSSLDALFGHSESTVLVLSKLIYHLIHCLIYRPFLPIDLAELAVTGQHQSWQIEATNMCFMHANAITELVELGKQTASTEWPAFVGYCICTAGTVHIHGVHYNRTGGRGGNMGAIAASADFLSREMQQLSELRYAWASVQHQRETLQNVYNAHAELVKSLANNAMRYSPAFNTENFFGRYAQLRAPNGEPFTFDAANLSLKDIVIDFTVDTYTGHDLYAPRRGSAAERPNLKRKFTNGLGPQRADVSGLELLSPSMGSHMSNGLPTPGLQSRSLSFPTKMHNHVSVPPQPGTQTGAHKQDSIADSVAAAGFSMTPPQQLQHIPSFSANSFPQHHNFGTPLHNTQDSAEQGMSSYDPMFGTMPTNAFSSPAPWQGDHEKKESGEDTSPEALSHGVNTPGGASDDKDPFLSLLEQLAENEQALGQGNELDCFLAGAQG